MSLRSRQLISREEVIVANAIVAAGHPLEAEVGIDILKAGGNAVDAAVAVGFLAVVVEPVMTVLGSCGFLLYMDGASGESWCIDFAPRAPERSRPDMFRVLDEPAVATTLGSALVENDANASGHLSVGVPGLVKGLCRAHAQWGRLPFSQVIEPAIHCAEAGCVCDWYTAYCIASDLRWFQRYPESGKTFLPGGQIPDQRVPAKIVQRELADTLRRISREADRDFYQGEIAHAIADDMTENGGILTAEDLKAYDVDVYRPPSITYRGYEILFPAAPCGVWTIAQTLNLLECSNLGGFEHNGPEHLQILIEASRHAFVDRYYYLGDPDHVACPLKGILSKGYARELHGKIARMTAELGRGAAAEPWVTFAGSPLHDPWGHDGGRKPPQPWGISVPPASAGHTTHCSIVDKDRNLVSLTQTAGEHFGAKFTTPGTGIMHADAMVWFNPHPGTANSVGPRKRPLCNMGTLLVRKDERPFMALGASGGRRIIGCLVQIISNVVDFGMSMQSAISAPRIDASGRVTLYNDRIEPKAIARLCAMGHALQGVSEEYYPVIWEFGRAAGVLVSEDGLLRGGVEATARAEARGT